MFSLCSVRTQRHSKGDQLSSKSCSAAVRWSQNILPIQLITQTGQTCLESTSYCLLPREHSGTHQTEHSCLQVESLISEQVLYWHQKLFVLTNSLRGNSAQPKVDAIGWMTPLSALTKLHWSLSHPPFSLQCCDGWVSSSESESNCTVQCLWVLHLGAATVDCSCVASAEIDNANELVRILHPFTFNTALLKGAHITLFPCLRASYKFTALGAEWHCLLSPSSFLHLLQCAVLASHSLYAAEKTVGLEICHSSLQKCLSSLNILVAKWGSDSHLHYGIIN